MCLISKFISVEVFCIINSRAFEIISVNSCRSVCIVGSTDTYTCR